MTKAERAKLEREYQHLRVVKRRYRAFLFSLPNVVGVGVGYKVTKGERAEQRAVRVYVTEKKTLGSLRTRERIPVHLEGTPTDVIQVGEMCLSDGHTTRERPAKGGASLGDDEGCGTLGGVFVDNTDDAWVILSCNHIIAKASDENHNYAEVGAFIIQPSICDGGSIPGDIIAILRRWKVFEVPPQWNKVDAAIAEVADTPDVSNAIHDIGTPLTYRRLTVEDVENETVVQKSGSSSGYTQGLVFDVSVDSKWPYPHGELWFEDQISIKSIGGVDFGEAGDSGSTIQDMQMRHVALLFGNSQPWGSWAHHIDNVLDALNISVIATSTSTSTSTSTTTITSTSTSTTSTSTSTTTITTTSTSTTTTSTSTSTTTTSTSTTTITATSTSSSTTTTSTSTTTTTTLGPCPTWMSAVSHIGTGAGWHDPENAYQVAGYAWHDIISGHWLTGIDWSDWLQLQFDQTYASTAVKWYVSWIYGAVKAGLKLQYEVYTGSWELVSQEIPAFPGWVEVTFAERNISAMRIRFGSAYTFPRNQIEPRIHNSFVCAPYITTSTSTSSTSTSTSTTTTIAVPRTYYFLA